MTFVGALLRHDFAPMVCDSRREQTEVAMKASLFLCASVAVLATTLVWTGARAAPGESSQKGLSFFRLADDPAAAKACTDKGGAVSTDQDGYKICTMPRSCPAPGGATRSTKIDANDAAAAKRCQDTCGVVSTDASGAKVCTKPEGA
jgi:hypothetical protein